MDVANVLKIAVNGKKSKEPTNQFNVTEEHMRPIKLLCKESNQNIDELFRYLSVDLTRKSGISRLKALYIINELFHRSKYFRNIINNNIHLIAQTANLLKHHSRNNAIILPNDYHNELESRVKEYIELWNHAYGQHYPQLKAIARYFKESLALKMPNIVVNILHLFSKLISYQHLLANTYYVDMYSTGESTAVASEECRQ